MESFDLFEPRMPKTIKKEKLKVEKELAEDKLYE